MGGWFVWFLCGFGFVFVDSIDLIRLGLADQRVVVVGFYDLCFEQLNQLLLLTFFLFWQDCIYCDIKSFGKNQKEERKGKEKAK